MMSASARLLDLFMQAQQREDADDASGATKLYEKLIQYAEANVSPDISSVADEALTSALSPPADLVVSTALTSLGGMHLDTCTLEEARRCFRRSLSWWPGNGMALLNLGDIERGKRQSLGSERCLDRTHRLHQRRNLLTHDLYSLNRCQAVRVNGSPALRPTVTRNPKNRTISDVSTLNQCPYSPLYSVLVARPPLVLSLSAAAITYALVFRNWYVIGSLEPLSLAAT
jgi:hypothetical protein